jgi:hypothetical protein
MKMYLEYRNSVETGTLHKDLIVSHIIVSNITVSSAATKATHYCVSMATGYANAPHLTLYVRCLSYLYMNRA